MMKYLDCYFINQKYTCIFNLLPLIKKKSNFKIENLIQFIVFPFLNKVIMHVLFFYHSFLIFLYFKLKFMIFFALSTKLGYTKPHYKKSLKKLWNFMELNKKKYFSKFSLNISMCSIFFYSSSYKYRLTPSYIMILKSLISTLFQ